MAKKSSSTATLKQVETLTHEEASRKNIPTAEYQSLLDKDQGSPIQVAYERRNKDLDPQLVWRGKDVTDWSDLVVQAPPLFIQEKIHPKVLIDDLMRRPETEQLELFGDFNGVSDPSAKTEFYRHDANWTNRMILGDSLQVMASLAEREGLRGQVQCIYIDPPYGIKFNSNFQWSTTSRDVKDGAREHITREPEQVKAFRDTWRDGLHSYLTYLRDRILVARELLTDTGSLFVQIGDENVHLVRAILDEVFGKENAVSLISFRKTSGSTSDVLPVTNDYIVWYAKRRETVKFRALFEPKTPGEKGATDYRDGASLGLRPGQLTLQAILSPGFRQNTSCAYSFRGRTYDSGTHRNWKTTVIGLDRLTRADRLFGSTTTMAYVRYLADFPVNPRTHVWMDTWSAGFAEDRTYVVQTSNAVVQRCLLMTTDPGDLVLDPTCGSGTSAYVAEQWGRRWITVDTSRVALALARARIMGARYPFYLLADSREGQVKEGELTRSVPSEAPTRNNIRHGFVYERVPHITLKSIANNAEIDVIWDRFQAKLEPLRQGLNTALGKSWEEWEIPREADTKWPDAAQKAHAEWWRQRIARQKEIDASIAAKAEYEYLYDRPYEDKKKVRVAGPFTVESVSPHRTLGVDENDELIDQVADTEGRYGEPQDFATMILENLRTAGVQQAHKEDRISFTSLTPWPGTLICAEGRYLEGEGEAATERRAGIFLGPEFGTVSRPDLVDAAKEAAESGFDVLIACAFNYEAHAGDLHKAGRIPVLKARMNADLHMAGDLKNTGKGNLFVIFGEPDIDVLRLPGDQFQVRINGVDVFHPNTGEVRSDGPDGIACWFLDTDYNGESFFVRHAYFLGANDPYKALKTTLKAEVDEEAWESLHSNLSRPFDKPRSNRIAVKVINHLGDEVMKIYRV